MNAASLGLSAAAFGVALVALYLSNLKRADLVILAPPEATPYFGGGRSWNSEREMTVELRRPSLCSIGERDPESS
jgi:hypothetical protein